MCPIEGAVNTLEQTGPYNCIDSRIEWNWQHELEMPPNFEVNICIENTPTEVCLPFGDWQERYVRSNAIPPSELKKEIDLFLLDMGSALIDCDQELDRAGLRLAFGIAPDGSVAG